MNILAILISIVLILLTKYELEEMPTIAYILYCLIGTVFIFMMLGWI